MRHAFEQELRRTKDEYKGIIGGLILIIFILLALLIFSATGGSSGNEFFVY